MVNYKEILFFVFDELGKKKQIIKYSENFLFTNSPSPIRSGNILIRHKQNKFRWFFDFSFWKKNIEEDANDIVFVSMSEEVQKNKTPFIRMEVSFRPL